MAGASGSWAFEDEWDEWQSGVSLTQTPPSAFERVGGAIYDAAGNVVDWVVDTAGGMQQAMADEVQRELEMLRTAGQQFSVEYARFAVLGPELQGTAMFSEWSSLKTRADIARGSLDGIATAASTLYGYAKSAFGLSGVRERVQRLDGGLGAIPFITAAMVVGTAAVIGVLTTDMARFVMNYNLTKSGRPVLPGQTGSTTGGALSDISGTVKWLVVGGAAVMLLPPILKAFEGKR